jgi:small-conductance mechanosensitive channel
VEAVILYSKKMYDKIYHLITTEVFTEIGLIQLGILIIIILASYYLTSVIRKIIRRHLSADPRYKSLFEAIIGFLYPFFFFVIASLAQIAVQRIGWNSLAFNIFATYFGVRVVNKLLSLLLKEAFWLPLLKTTIWVMAILNLLNILNDTVSLLDKIGFSIGDNHISLLIVIKSAVTILLALWIANSLANLMSQNISRNKHLNASIKLLLGKTIKIILIILAVIISMNILGIKLTAMAVLGGAIGVGVGFGLQKIVSNFISGFILLLDKSIRPGDVIEIDDTFGVIQSLSTRYVTLLTIEGKEHLIPNEDLITQKVINWSHTNRLIRLSVDVGVSYSTDIPKALELITEAARKSKRIDKSRQPRGSLTNFGNSSIDLRVVFWIKDPEFGIDNIKSEIRLEIWKLFKENDIQIPFPQNDVYIKSMPTAQEPV